MIKTRNATRDDTQAMADVINPIIAAGGTTAFEDQLSAADIEALVFDRPGVVSVVVALDEAGDVAGFQYLVQHPDLPDGVGDIASFACVKGAGRAMMAATIDAARKSGLVEINARIRADNVPGLGFYAAMGFHDHALDRGVPLRDGTPVDRISKRLKL